MFTHTRRLAAGIVMLAGALAGGLGSAQVQAQAPAPQAENTGPNAHILRWAEGTYSYETVKDKRVRGMERFYLNVHADGTRTMLMWHDLAARNAQFTVVLRVDGNYRPIEAFVNYWTQAGYKGSTHIFVHGDTLTANTNGPLGHLTQTLKVPHGFSIGTHPVSADGWHMWHLDPNNKQPQSGPIYSLDAAADLTRPVLGTMLQQQVEAMGEEKITVPAGTFTALRYRLAGISDVWITPQDHLMLRMVSEKTDRAYLLTTLKQGTGGATPGAK